MASANKIRCPKCGDEMNHHAEKLIYSSEDEKGYVPTFGGSVEEVHACPNCGASVSRLCVS